MSERRLSGKRKLSDDESPPPKHQNTGQIYKVTNVRQEAAGPSGRVQSVEVDENDELFLEDEGDTYIDGIRIPAPRNTETCASNKESRIIVTKIVSKFFKSYAEEQVLGPFHKCFNAIVGPNGSGKSNVIDSVLFVFGFRANKIRSKNIKVLIHHSEMHPNVPSCTVSVHFVEIIDRGGESYEIIPNSEFVISRSAFNDNSSCYEINGKRVQFREVALLLKRHGIDLQYSRFLILQGEVEQIALMKPKGEKEGEIGLLEYLEDIIGTNRYKRPLDQLKEREEILAGQRSKRLNRLRITQNQLDALKEPMQEAIKFLQIENNIAQLKNSIYQKNIFELEKQLTECGKEREEFATIAEELNEQIKTISKEKAEKEKILSQKSKEYEKLKKTQATIKEAFDKATNKDVQLLANMTQVNQNRKKYKEQLVTEKKKLTKLEQVPEESVKGIEECETKQQELLLKQEKFDKEKVKLLSEVRLETRELTEEKEELETELIKLKTVVDETKSKYTLAESQLKILTSNEDTEKNKFENLKTTLNDINELIDKRSIDLNKLKSEIPKKENLLKSANNKLNTVRQQESQFINEFKTQRSALEEKKSSMQASNTRGRVLNVLMQQKREGKCPGLYGRLGDLGGIDQKYDIAISTACGQLDFLVADTVDTAQWCIDYLKKYDIGRATFIALEKQEHLRQQCNKKIQTPENVHRLFDLIQVNDETVKTAFYYALRDTLVANDINQATRVAYGQQRYRVVTLKGEMIEMTGTMSGGGKHVSRGRMGKSATVVNINPKEIEELEINLNKSEDEIRKLRELHRTLEEEIENYESELEQMHRDLEKFSVELQSLEKQQPAIVNQLKQQENKVKLTKTNPVKVKELTTVVTTAKSSYDKALEKAGLLQVKVDKLTKQIDDKTTNKMRNVEKNITETVKMLTNCKNEITRLTVAIKTSKKNIEKSQEKIKVLEQDIENSENQLKQMKAERDETEEDAKKLITASDEIATSIVDEEKNFAETKNEVTDLKKRESKLLTSKIENDDKLKTIDEKLSDFNTTIHQFHARLKVLKIQDIPNETVSELQKFTVDELEKINTAQVERDLKLMQENLKTAKPNIPVIEEYYKTQTIFLERSKDFEEINKQHGTIRQTYENLRNQRKTEFLTGYNVIRFKVKEVYQMITIGGDADFDLIDSFDPFAEGIQFNVRPPRKCWKNLSNLSGGEKTLSSLALVFALHYYKPSPIYVMDEIDAALDFKNVSIIAHYIKERTKNTQFIIISLRSSMYEMGDLLVGIYKTFGCTKTVVLDPKVYDKQIQNDENININVQ